MKKSKIKSKTYRISRKLIGITGSPRYLTTAGNFAKNCELVQGNTIREFTDKRIVSNMIRSMSKKSPRYSFTVIEQIG